MAICKVIENYHGLRKREVMSIRFKNCRGATAVAGFLKKLRILRQAAKMTKMAAFGLLRRHFCEASTLRPPEPLFEDCISSNFHISSSHVHKAFLPSCWQEVCHKFAKLLQHANSQVREAAASALGRMTGDGRAFAIGLALTAAPSIFQSI